jgi:hypothetical protein
MLRRLALLMLCVLIPVRLQAQGDGLNLPTDLYILLNAGTVERYGVGAVGVTGVTPADTFIIDFSVSPDGEWIAYRTQDGLFLDDMTRADDEPVQLEGETASFPPLRQGGQTLTWGPGGETLAYTTETGLRLLRDLNQPTFAEVSISPLRDLVWSPDGTYIAAAAQDNVWWVYQSGTLELTGAIPSSVGVAWRDDARLIFAPVAGGLYQLDFANLNEQTELQPPPRLYRYPYVRPDGRLAVFTRNVNEPDIGEDGAFLRELALEGDAVTVETTSEADVDLTGVRWAPGGELLIALRGGVLVLVRPAIGDGFTLPVANAVGFGWGGLMNMSASLAEGIPAGEVAYFLAVDTFDVVQVWRLPADGATREQVTATEFDVEGYALNRAADTLAYVSENRLWSLALGDEAAEPVAVAQVGENALDVTFSPDGATLYYTTASQIDGGLWQVAANVTADPEGELTPNIADRILPNPDGQQIRRPRFAPNVNALLIETGGTAREFNFYDPISEALLMLGSYDNMLWIRDGRLLAWRGDGNGTQIDLIDPLTDPIALTPLATVGGQRVLDVAQIDIAGFHLLVEPISGIGPLNQTVLPLTLTGEIGDPVVAFPALRGARLNADGRLIGGQQGISNRAAVVTLEGEEFRLNQPANTQFFRWESMFR